MRARPDVVPGIVEGPGMSAKTIRLTVADAHGRHDLVVPSDSTVAELLTVGGVDLERYVGTTTSGAAIALDSEVSVTPGDGGVIWLFDRTAGSAGSDAPASRSVPAALSARRRWTSLALLLAIVSSMIASAVIVPSPLSIIASVVALSAGAIALLVQPITFENTYVAFLTPLLAASAGGIALAGFGDAGLMVASGMVVGATAACIRHAATQPHGREQSATTAVIATLWSVFAVVNAAAAIAEIPTAAITAVQLACAVPIFHYMRGRALDVHPHDLIDIPHVIRDAQGIRALPPAEPAPVHAEAAARQFHLARRRAEAGTVAACAMALLSGLYTLAAIRPPAIEAWCVLGGAIGAGCYFLLTPASSVTGSLEALR
jgi:hypothetical protein